MSGKEKNHNRIAKLRKEKGLTLQQVGNAIGVGNNTISRYETGKREPKLETWIKLADFFDVPVSYLQGLSEVNYRDETALRNQFNSSELAEKLGLHLQETDKPVINVNDLSLIQRDATLTAVGKLKELLFKEVINISSDKQYQQLSDKFNSISEKQANKLLFDMTMLFVLLLQDGNDKVKDLLYRIAEQYYNKHFR